MTDSDIKQDFQTSLAAKDQFTLTFELVPSRGGGTKEHSKALDFAGAAAADSRMHAVSITENAGGHPALSPEVLGREILNMGLDVISHFSCKDKNRNQMESLLFAWDRIGLHNLLVITGDYPQKGFRGHPKPVFDLGSVHVLDLLQCMNKGFPLSCSVDESAPRIQHTSFFKGVALSPFKYREAELMMQYYKLHRKVAGGADFVITQVGFDARKFHEVQLYMEQAGLSIPVLGNVFIPNLPVVEHMYRGRVPGCVIPENLYQQMQLEAKAEDKGKKARMNRAAKLLAVLKGLKYAGAHIGGPGLSFGDIDYILEKAAAYGDDWQACVKDLNFWPEQGCYYFHKDNLTGLNSPEPVADKAAHLHRSFSYTVSQQVHMALFSPAGIFYDPFRTLCLAFDTPRSSRALARFEHLIKFIGFNCRNCGDCTLAELGFLCPQSGCAKYLLNGPCGGSFDGWCEVYPGKKRCLYVRLYERLRPHGKEGSMKTGYTPPRNWALHNTSSWQNYFLGKDHTSR